VVDHSQIEYNRRAGEKGLWRIIQGGKSLGLQSRGIDKHLGRQERHSFTMDRGFI